MPTYYVSDYDGDRNDDAVDAAPAETDASPVDEGTVTAKVVSTDDKPEPKSTRATTKRR